MSAACLDGRAGDAAGASLLPSALLLSRQLQSHVCVCARKDEKDVYSLMKKLFRCFVVQFVLASLAESSSGRVSIHDPLLSSQHAGKDFGGDDS